MEPGDITVEILKSIRDEVRGLRSDFGGMAARVETIASRVDTITSRVDTITSRVDTIASDLKEVQRRQTESEVRLATELVGVAGAVLRGIMALEKKSG